MPRAIAARERILSAVRYRARSRRGFAHFSEHVDDSIIWRDSGEVEPALAGFQMVTYV